MVEIEIEIGIGIGIGIEIGIEIDSCSGWHLALTHCLNLDAEYCQRRNNTDAFPGLLWPNPIPRPFDTDTDSDPDPDLSSSLTFSDSFYLPGRRPPFFCWSFVSWVS